MQSQKDKKCLIKRKVFVYCTCIIKLKIEMAELKSWKPFSHGNESGLLLC